MKNKPVLNFAILLFCALLFATVQKAKAQAVIDEDFIGIIDQNVTSFWNENAPAFALSSTPEKWKNESAVIIAYKRSIMFDKQVKGGSWFSAGKQNVFLFEKVRFKIKLQDKNAVQNFTEVFFRYGDKLDGFAAKIYKPDGTKQEVDLSDAVEAGDKSQVPEFYKSFFDQNTGGETRYYKVAIPNLETGDVLEYISYTKSKLNVVRSKYVEFDPQYEICSKKYPIMYNEISIDTDDKTFFKSLSQNGAPEFKKENSDAEGFYRYVFIDRDRGTEKDVNFISPILAYPMIKFQVIYSNNENAKGALIGDKGELKTGFTKEELGKTAWENYALAGGYWINQSATAQNAAYYILSQMKKDDVLDLPEDKFIVNAYYRIRNLVLFRNTYFPDKVFAYMLTTILSQRKINYDLVISVSNKMGKLSDILFEDEIRYAVKVGNKFYFNCTDHSNPGELVESLLGNDAYIIKAPSRSGEQEITDIKLPDTDVSENTAQYDINVQYNPATNNMVVSRSSTYNGLTKAREIDDVVKYTPYMFDDFRVYFGSSPLDKMSSKQIDEYYSTVNAIKEEFKTSKPEYVQQQLDKEFTQKLKYKNFRLTSDGRSLQKKQLTAVEDFEISEMSKHAGKKILLNLPGLMGSQLQITNEERLRTKGIQVGFARILNWRIVMPVPAGYTVKGLKELNTIVDNEAGKFSCEAKEENGNVILLMTKVYKKREMPKEKWNDMLAFVDAAYNQTFRYILLVPKN